MGCPCRPCSLTSEVSGDAYAGRLPRPSIFSERSSSGRRCVGTVGDVQRPGREYGMLACHVSLVAAEPVPLRTDPEGVVRVQGTRVTLDTVVAAFKAGARAEEIAYDYPSLELADVYAVLTYYLRHQNEVADYLRRRMENAAEIRLQNEPRFSRRDFGSNCWPAFDL